MRQATCDVRRAMMCDVQRVVISRRFSSPFPMMLSHAATIVVSMLLQGGSISMQGGSGLPSLTLLRIIVAGEMTHAAACVIGQCREALACRRSRSCASSSPSPPSPFPMMLTHAARASFQCRCRAAVSQSREALACRRSRSCASSSPSPPTPFPMMLTHAAACVISMLNALTGQQHLKSEGLLPAVTLAPAHRRRPRRRHLFR